MAGGNQLLPVYPLFAVVGTAIVLCGWYGTRLLTRHNDVVINKQSPMQFENKESPKIFSRDYAEGTFNRYRRTEGEKKN
jgi:hypothetical protein